jgi:hypothetical protein
LLQIDFNEFFIVFKIGFDKSCIDALESSDTGAAPDFYRRNTSTMKNFLTIVFVLGCAALNAFGGGLTVTGAISVGGKELKPGEYKFEMEGDKVVFREGKAIVAEAPAGTEAAAQKFHDTTYEAKGGKITAIRIGGTMIRIVLK